MRKITLFLFVVCATCLYAQEPVPKDFYHLNGDLLDAAFTGERGIHIVGSNGVILRSSDGGVSWAQTISGTHEALRGIAFFDEMTGICAGGKGTVLRTTDAGKEWVRSEVPGKPEIKSVAVQGSIALAVADSGTVLRSADSGKTWSSSQISGEKGSLCGVSFLTEKIALISAPDGVLYRSVDAGLTWTKKVIGGAPYIAPTLLHISPDGVVYVGYSISNVPIILNKSILYTSTDRGENWTSIPLDIQTTAVAFMNSSTATILSNSPWINTEGNQIFRSPIRRTTDGGKTVIIGGVDTTDIQRTPYDVLLTAVRFKNSLEGIVLGEKKTIYSTTDGGNSWQLLSYCSGTNESSFGQVPFSFIRFLNDTTGFASAGQAKIFRTDNAGATWLPCKRNVPPGLGYNTYYSQITDMDFINDTVAFALTDRDSDPLVMTRDGWKTYNFLPDYTGKPGSVMTKGSAMKFFTEKKAVVIGSVQTQWTQDGGLSWVKKQTIFGADSLYKLGQAYIAPDEKFMLIPAIINRKHYGTDQYAGIYRSTDSGATWSFIPVPQATSLGNFCFISKDTGFVAGAQVKKDYSTTPRMFKTVDGGLTWRLIDSNRVLKGFRSSLSRTSFSGTTLYSVGDKGSALISKDRGATWEDISAVETMTDYSSVFADEKNAYIGGYKNTLLKRLPSKTATSVAERTEAQITNSFKDIWMKEAYPNPATSTITLKIFYSLALNKNDIKVSVYSMTGERVAYITESFRQSTGNNPALVQWNTQGLPAGMYIIEAKGGNAQMTIPVVIAR